MEVKAGQNVKAVLVLVFDVSANISSTFQAMPNPSAYLISQCLPVLCRFVSILGKTFFQGMG